MKLLERLAARRLEIEEGIRMPIIKDWFEDRKPLASTSRTEAMLAAQPGVKLSLVNLLNQLKAEVDSVTVDGRIELKEVVQFAVRAMRLIFAELKKLDFDSETNREVVLYALDEFYLQVLAPLDIPGVPAFIENRFVDPLIGSWWHDAADGIYDALFEDLPVVPVKVEPTGSANPNG